jgi:stage V sporulation protein G
MIWPTSSPGQRKGTYVRQERFEEVGNGTPDSFDPRPRTSPSEDERWEPDDSVHEEHPSGIAITDVQVRLVDNDRLRAWATITLNNAFVVKGIRIIRGNQRVFVAMPSKQQKDGKYQDIAHPISKDFRDFLEHRILAVYHQVESESGGGMRASPGDDFD